MKWYFDPEQRVYWSLGDGDDEIFVRQDAIQSQGEMASVMLGVNLDGIQDAEERPVLLGDDLHQPIRLPAKIRMSSCYQADIHTDQGKT